ncbi:MAG: c-type cytochrome [Pedosphaera sp.]|nr:c-type cytochrome [Pedosphaera sp.]
MFTRHPSFGWRRAVFLMVWFVVGFSVGRAAAAAGPRLDPASYVLHPDLEMTLWAAEPDIVDPVAMCFDERGRAYVVEMRDFPLGMGPNHEPGGTVRLLEDRDGDGIPERSTVFADRLSYPTSITPWRGGVLVTAPPQVLWLVDTNGDGRADVREVILDGFHLGVTDSNVNGLRFGLDGRIHGANGGNGGQIRSPRKPGVTLPLGNNDFSFDPDTGNCEVTGQTGGGFGLVFDEWGRSYTTYNINHVQHRFMPRHNAIQFPGFPSEELTGSISDHEEMSVIFPVSAPQTRPNHPEQSGHFSSAGGIGILLSSAFPPEMQGNVLVCDVVGNLVHRDVIEVAGPVFLASRAKDEQAREFFASRDPACRPVGIEVGPDGALYLLDMQRDVIEHPDYIPDKLKATIHLRAGEDRGRIYRITPKGGLKPVVVSLDRADPAQWVTLLGDSRAWWRLTAHRLLRERGPREVLPALKNMAQSTISRAKESPTPAGGQVTRVTLEKFTQPLARVHALWLLRSFRELRETEVRSALSDGEPGVRENAAQLAADFLPDKIALANPLLELASDRSPRVRFEAALAFGRLGRSDALAGLQQVLRTDYIHRWSRLAVWSSLGPNLAPLVTGLVQDGNWRDTTSEQRLDAWRELAELAGARAEVAPEEAAYLWSKMETTVAEAVRIRVAQGLAAGLARSGGAPILGSTGREALKQLHISRNPNAIQAGWQLSRILKQPETPDQLKSMENAAQNSTNRSLSLEKRLAGIQLLEFSTHSLPTLLTLLEGIEPAMIQSAAVSILRSHSDPTVGQSLVGRWRSLAPALRPSILNVLLDKRPFHESLVAALERGEIKVGELNLDLEQRRRLLRESSDSIKVRAGKFLSDEEYSNRKVVVQEWLARLPATGDWVRGRLLFEQTCSPCHRAGEVGNRVGPDLTSVAHRSVEDLVSNILDPNMAINPGFVAFTAMTKSGTLETGVLQSENTDSITLLQALGKKLVLARRDLARLESNGQSLMPEGLETGRTPQELRDLVAFLQDTR